jgi:hypothetical protein
MLLWSAARGTILNSASPPQARQSSGPPFGLRRGLLRGRSQCFRGWYYCSAYLYSGIAHRCSANFPTTNGASRSNTEPAPENMPSAVSGSTGSEPEHRKQDKGRLRSDPVAPTKEAKALREKYGVTELEKPTNPPFYLASQQLGRESRKR